MKKVAVEVNGRTLYLSEHAARIARAKQAELKARWDRFAEGDRTVQRLATAGNQLAGWIRS